MPRKDVRDVSDKTIAIMLVVVIVVSVMSLGVYFFALDSFSNKTGESVGLPQSNQGTVELKIISPPEVNDENSLK